MGMLDIRVASTIYVHNVKAYIIALLNRSQQEVSGMDGMLWNTEEDERFRTYYLRLNAQSSHLLDKQSLSDI